MANEFTLNLFLQLKNGILQPGPIRETGIQFDQTTAARVADTISVATTDTSINTGGLTTPGWMFMKNLDPTNFVEYGPESGGAMIPCGKLLANGGIGLVYLAAGVTFELKANTAACQVYYELFDA